MIGRHLVRFRAPFQGAIQLVGLLASFLASLSILVPARAAGQAEDADVEALRVFLDCQTSAGCQRDHFRREIGFVDWVREPQDAHVHVILTRQDLGLGGSRLTLDFLGRAELGGLSDTYDHSASATDVDDEVVEGVTRLLRRGLVRYATHLGAAGRFEVRPLDGGGGGREAATFRSTSREDPWDFWVFELEADGRLEREERTESHEIEFGIRANRTTMEWKVDVEAEGSFFRSEFELDDRTVENHQEEWTISGFAVRSASEHVGIGAQVELNNSTRLNRDRLVAVGTGVEWNFFPYQESNRRVFLARYVVSVERVSYQDTTVFDVLRETAYRHEVGVDYEAREPWGNANVGLGASQFLDRTGFYSLELDGRLEYRLFRGLSFTFDAEYGVVRDQIYVSREELSDEDILLGRRQLPTDSTVDLSVGLEYSFGSIFNNVVNPRFRNGIR